MGTPTPAQWVDVINPPWFERVKPQHPVILPVDHLVIANTLITSLVGLQGEWHELETKQERAKRKERKNAS